MYKAQEYKSQCKYDIFLKYTLNFVLSIVSLVKVSPKHPENSKLYVEPFAAERGFN